LHRKLSTVSIRQRQDHSYRPGAAAVTDVGKLRKGILLRFSVEAEKSRAEAWHLQGAEEFEESLFFGGLELVEIFGDMGGFALVP
jgi:hypothetical protein